MRLSRLSEVQRPLTRRSDVQCPALARQTFAAEPAAREEQHTSTSSRDAACGHSSSTAALQRLERAFGRHAKAGMQHGPHVLAVALDNKPPKTKKDQRTPDYYANVGDAVRTLRDEIPLLFINDLTCKCSLSSSG